MFIVGNIKTNKTINKMTHFFTKVKVAGATVLSCKPVYSLFIWSYLTTYMVYHAL